MDVAEKEAFKDVLTKFLGNEKDPNFKSIVETILQKYVPKFTLLHAFEG